MNMIDLIAAKRDGQVLETADIDAFIHALVRDEIPDYQVAAWLMAVYLRGMNRRETIDLTLAMARSGDVLDLSDIIDYTVDKHSSGGVGDKTSLVVLPMVSACGVPLAKMSGRGLGFTGGTIDKLESIHGFRVDLSAEEFRRAVQQHGIVLAGQSLTLAPADGRLYALRDVTATISCLPLIASSIMSKKIAAGANGIVLDVKVGEGAFMKTLEEARALAGLMVEIGVGAGRDVTALLSDMNQPLGAAVGNAIEVAEAVETLHGGGPEDFREHCTVVAGEMLRLAGRGERWVDADEARAAATATLDDGRALAKFRALVEAQGGDVRQVDDPRLLPQARLTETIHAPQDAVVAGIVPTTVARAAYDLGAGRAKKSDAIDLAVGVAVPVKVGERVQRGQEIGRLYANDEASLVASRALLESAFAWSSTPVAPLPLFHGVLRSSDQS